MATSKQEKIYNQIVQYYNFADKLLNLLEENKDDQEIEKYIEVVESIVEYLEDFTNDLSLKYIEFVKNGDENNLAQEIKDLLANNQTIIEDYKQKIKNLEQYSCKILPQLMIFISYYPTSLIRLIN